MEKQDSLNRREGFTLLELVISMALVVVILGGALNLVLKSTLALEQEAREFTLDQTGWRAIDRIAEDLAGAASMTILPVVIADSDWLQYQKITGYDEVSGTPLLGPVTTIDVRPMAGETANGVDDNADGRVDEGFLTITVTGNDPVQIAGNVVGLRFNSTVNGVTFDVDIGILDRDGNVQQRTFTRELRVRN